MVHNDRKDKTMDDKENFTVRRLEISELPVLTKLFHYKDINKMILETMASMEQGIEDIFVLYQEKELLGEIHVNYCSTDEQEAMPGKRVYLYAYRVKKGYQNRGIGSFLMRQVLDQLENRGYTEFTIGVEDNNEIAKHIYKKFGFQEIIARKQGQDDEESEPYQYNLLLRRKSFCYDFIFIAGKDEKLKSEICQKLCENYHTKYWEQNQMFQEGGRPNGMENIIGISEEEIRWQCFAAALRYHYELGFRNTIVGIEELQINDVPEIFQEYRCIIFWLVCDNGQQIDKRIENTKESMDFKNIEIMSEKEEKQFWIKNMYKVNTTGKIPEQVCSEIIQQVDLLKTSLY